MTTFLITGATGFIGGALASDLLYSGHKVIALCRDGDPPIGCEVIRGEIENLSTCERAINEHQPDGVFHLAAQAIVGNAKRDPFSTFETNVRGTYNLLEAFRRHRKPSAKMVVASSDKAYGELSGDAINYNEDMPLKGRGPYDCSKSCTDLIAQSYGDTYSLPIAIVRAGNVYGPGDSDMTRIVPSMVDDVVNNRPITIMSDGSPVRDYIYVDDVVAGYIAAYEMHKLSSSSAFNLATGRGISVLELVTTFINCMHEASCAAIVRLSLLNFIKEYLKNYEENGISVLKIRRGEIQTQILNTSKAHSILKWKADVSVQSGLLKTLVATWDTRTYE